MATLIQTWLNYALQQMAAESYLDQFLLGPRSLVEVLSNGNNNENVIPVDQFTGKTRFADLTGVANAAQVTGSAQAFESRYQIVNHHANDASGFSATLMLDTDNNSYTLSFRSTEPRPTVEGGDAERDGLFASGLTPAADGEIGLSGFAFGQLMAMERYYLELTTSGTLPTGATLNVTGYSLGGHLATVFTELHASQVAQTTVFNASGRGRIEGFSGTDAATLSAEAQQIDTLLFRFMTILFDPSAGVTQSSDEELVAFQAARDAHSANPIWNPFTSGLTENLYVDPRYRWAKSVTLGEFNTVGTAELEIRTGLSGITVTEGAFSKITQIYGNAAGGDDTLVALSGLSAGPAQSVLIEGQPLLPGTIISRLSDAGSSHSITLIVDSLAVQALIQTIDPAYRQAGAELLIRSASNTRAIDTLTQERAEGDSLEKTVDAFRKLFLGPALPDPNPLNVDFAVGGFANFTFRNEMYTAMAVIQQAAETLQAQGVVFTIADLTNPTIGAPTIAGLADTDTDQGLAYRYALKELNPFAVIANTPQANDVLYQDHNTQGQLDRFNVADGTGTLTTQYLTDRALFLAEKLALNQLDQDTSSRNIHFMDVTSTYEIKTPTVLSLARREFLFGSDDIDTLTGGSKDDHLYGGGSVDVLIGNGGQDYLEGNGGSDRLEGGAGADTMLGGAGNDTYLVDDPGDQVIEAPNNGRDAVESSVTFTLGANVEDLTLTGTKDMDGTGNNLDNLIIGNNGVNRLKGLDGTDTLQGGIGADILEGGAGNNDLLEGGAGFDTYIYNAGDGTDRIEDSDASGQIIFNGHRLLGGIHDPNDPLNTYKSLDGLTTYVLSGTDLIVNGVLTVNENFQSGQFGIQLRDVSEADYTNGLPTLLDTGTEGDDVIAVGGVQGTVNHIVHALGGNDYVLGAANNDQLFGESGNDSVFGNSGDDRVYGGTGNDLLVGDNGNVLADPDGNDLVDGGDGSDFLAGGFGDDVLLGGEGNDVLWGDYDAIYPGKVPGTSSQDDFLDGGVGDDELHGGDGNDVLYGSTGNDFLLGEAGDDIEDGGAGDDLILAYIGDDSLAGGAGLDQLYGDQGNDILDGGDDADSLYGGDGGDELYGGAGNDLLLGDGLNSPLQLSAAGGADFLDGGAGNDHLEGGIGDDTLFGGTENDVLFGDEGADSIFGDDGDDELQGGDGIDLLLGDAGNDRLFGQADNDTLYGDEGNDTLAGNDGNDTLIGGDGNDVVEGGHGDDSLVGGSGSDTYLFNLGDGQDTITDKALVGEGNLIQFGFGITLESLAFIQDQAQQTLTIQVAGGDSLRLLGFDSNTFNYVVDTLVFANGTQAAVADQLPLPEGLVEGTDGNNVIRTGSGDDVIEARAGADLIDAGAGNDTLIGGAGNDVLTGGVGDDTYVFNLGDGVDAINDLAVAGAGNSVVFGAGITPETLTLGLGSGLQVHVGTSGDALALSSFNPNDVLGAHAIDRFQFADGTTLSYEQLLGLGFDIDGTEAGEFIGGTSLTDRITGRGGSDSIQGNAGDDTIDAGAGDDFVDAGEENDTVQGGEGNDTIFAGTGNDTVFGGAGDDTIYGQGGTDVVDGGSGNDRLVGAPGSYTYAFGIGSGQDIIESGQGGTYTIQMSAEVLPSDVIVGRVDQTITLSLNGGFDALTLPSFYVNHAFQVQFADGTVWDSNTIHNQAGDSRQVGTSGTDFLLGYKGFPDELIGLAGDDVYTVSDLGDVVVEAADEGHDQVSSAVDFTLPENVEDLRLDDPFAIPDGSGGYSFVDTPATSAVGNAVDNILTGNSYDNVITAGAGDDTLYGGDAIGGDSSLSDDDTLVGGGGSDTYLYNAFYSGIDTIIDESSASESNILRISNLIHFDGDNPLDGFHLRLDGSVLVMTMDVHDSSAIEHTQEVRFPNFNPNDAYGPHAIDVFDFYDGNLLSYQQLIDLGIDVQGTSQDDVVTGTNAPNWIHGGAGNDTLIGGPRNDVYFFNRGDGADTIVDTAVTGAMNEIRFGDGLNLGDLEVVQGTNALTLQVGSSGDAVVLSNYDPSGQAGSSVIGSVTVTNGLYLSLDELLNFPGGTGGNDTFVGTDGSDRYNAKGGNDVVIGGGGNDLLLGGTGLDDLKGDAGDDRLFGGAGDDRLDGGLDADELGGGAGNDTLTGGIGDDLLEGGDGADGYVFNRGDGHDVIRDSSNVGGDNRLLFGPGITLSDLNLSVDYGGQFGVTIDGVNIIINRIYVAGFDEYIDLPNVRDVAPALRTVSFADGVTVDIFDYYAASQIQTDQNLNAGNGDATLIGGVGNDTLQGGAGNSVLIGGGGNNTLIGGTGRTTFYSASAANNTVFFGSGSNVLVIPAGSSSNTVHALGAPASNSVVFGGGYSSFLPNLGFGSLLIRYGSEGGELHIEGFDPNDAYANPGIGTFQFIDQTLTYQQLMDLGFDISGTDEGNVLTGSSAMDRIKGLGGNDTLESGLGADVLEGGQGDDHLSGGTGDDTYVFNAGDGIDTIQDVAGAGEGNRIQFGTGISQSDLTFTQDSTARMLTIQVGSSGTDQLVLTNFDPTGANGSLVVQSVAFADGSTAQLADLLGSTGAITGTAGNDVLTGTAGDDLINALAGNDLVSGLAGNDALDGGQGDDTLDGGAGADALIGGTGNDLYVVDNVDDVVTENANEGADTVQSSISYTLGANVENLTLTSVANLNGTGNAQANFLTGNSGNSVLDGAAGADTMVGGDGNDTYVIDNIGDAVTESLNEGVDSVQSSITYTLGANVENLTLTETAAINGTGNSLNNVLTGNSSNNVLDGGAAADLLIGGAGDDIFQMSVDGTWASGFAAKNNGSPGSAGTGQTVSVNGKNRSFDVFQGDAGADRVLGTAGDDALALDDPLSSFPGAAGPRMAGVELIDVGDGNDVVDLTSLGYSYGDVTLIGGNGDDTLWANAGNDMLQGGTGNDNLYGGAGSDQLMGGDGNDTLDGNAGADTLVGGLGNDTYLVDDANDVVTESGNEGTDTVKSSITYALGANLENLTMTGTAAINAIGNSASNTLTGNSAANVLVGGLGNDTYVVDNVGDVVAEQVNEGTDTVQSSITYTLGANVENLTLTGTAVINGTGNNLANTLTGNSAANVLEGSLGDDTYVVGLGDTVVENLNEGTDTVQSSITYTLAVNVENLALSGSSVIDGTGNALSNVLTGNSAANVLIGGTGDDRYIVGAGDTVVEQLNEGTDTVQSAVTWTLSANVENLTLTGSTVVNGTGNALNNVLTGNSAANVLDGGAGDDQLTGGAGADTLLGGSGNDLYVVDNVGDVVTEQLSEGLDRVQSSVSYTLSANVEQLSLTGTGAITATGNSLNNVLAGNSGANVLDGGIGADTLVGGTGNDTYVVDNAGDVVTENANEGTDTVQASVNYTLGVNLDILTLTGTAAIAGTGNAANNVLTGNSGNNVLDGGGGTDTLRGGVGDDTYVIDDATDVVTENLNEGIDTVRTALTYTLGANVENLVLTGIVVVNGTGNTLNNVLTGNSVANTLNGGTGADSLIGGQGDDTYIVDNVGDVVTENLNEGTDTVQSSVSYLLSTNVENLTLTGMGAINGTGNSLNNILTGNAGANVLDGGTGADTLVGGAGNDTYVVDDLGDVVTELLNQGTDTVQSAVSYTLGSDLENLTLTGTAALSGTGNSLNNVLTGNSAANVLSGGDGNDTLDGGAGADSLLGGLGNDTYLVDSGSDIITEQLNEGTDTVQSSVTYTLAANVEHLTLIGTAAVNATGNALVNTLTGNSAVNVLTGGASNDTYVVSTGDTVVEQVNEGTDTVQSDVSWTLGANLENLTLTGTAAIAGSGNTLANTLRGNSAANVLTGGAGNDTYVVSTGDTVVEQVNEGTDTVQSDVSWTLGANLENLTLTGAAAINAAGNGLANVLTGNGAANQLASGTGNDTLRGGLGNDTYLVNRGEGQDLIAENDATVGNADTLLYGATINPLDLVLSRQANDLRLAIHGSTDYVTVQNWYSTPTTAQVETIQAGNGQALLSTQVDQLIQAMAGFTSQSGLTWDQAIDQRPQDVQTVLAASWQ